MKKASAFAKNLKNQETYAYSKAVVDKKTWTPAYAKASAFVPINVVTAADKTAGRESKRSFFIAGEIRRR